MVITSVPAFQIIASGLAAFVSKHNGSRETAKDNQEAQATTPSAHGGSRRARAGFSDSFSSQDLRSLNLDEDVSVHELSSRGVSEDEYCPRSLGSGASSPMTSTSDSDGRGSRTATSDSDPRANYQWRGFFRILKKGPQYPFPTFPPKGAQKPKLTRRKSKRVREDFIPQINSPTLRSFDADFCRFKSSWKNYSLLELEAATNNFSHENLIGEGGYAEVYKGTLEDGQIVAIKRLTRGSQEEMTADFLSELGVIVHVDHPNIAKLIGYGVEGGMHLVLHLSPHGSLSSILYGPRESLDWDIRYKVAFGTAKGLLYLHEGCQRRIIHKDIKASNILLAEDFEPQISDFGLAKWLPDSWTHHVVSKFEGTFGYLPPEFFMHGIVDEKTDVYAYGVLLLELITGRQALDSSHKSLVMWAKPLLSMNNIKEIVDPCLGDAYDLKEMKRLALTASFCVHQSSMNRPQMSQIVQILEGDETSLEYATKYHKSKLQRTYSEELLDADEYNSTKYLSDRDKQLEFILGTSSSNEA
ncbi:receptor-like cytosolic serine/threonine-protein kinase RBK2 [Pyrus ussuriensis x Pyrus communis]|uniref:non-specific serine/threonine protein kinase n=1 Tax=Pyrus ussuriensis x Pyrus communis TaxID=2448454 RepID=A0A5N5F8V1_9ROSA|nr:receptor-like cytosolic serine/threonine-protein kinase RBK2 [Pyrus ussuriensis x Pyrus communis]